MRKEVYFLLFFTIFFKSFVFTQSVELEFLKLSPDARGASLGETIVSDSDNIYSIYWNPSGLGEIKRYEVGLSYSKWILDTYYISSVFGRNINRIGSFATGLIFFHSGEIGEENLISNYDLSLSLGYGKRIKNFNFGFAIKYIRKYIFEEIREILGIDIGGRIKFENNKLKWGFNLKNIELKDKNKSLNTSIDIGILYNLFSTKELTINLLGGGEVYFKDVDLIKTGMEFNFRNFVFIRFGYIFTTKEFVRRATQKWRFGVGGKIENLFIDISYMPYNLLGECIQTSIQFKF